MIKHGEIAEYLAALDRDSVSLTFAEIEEILGHPLPPSARDHNAWWSNPSNDSHKWARAWVVAGWRTEHVNLSEDAIHFRRAQPSSYHEIDSPEAIEGYRHDRNILSRSRNAGLARRCKERDNYTCLACGFSLQIGETYVIECHHLNPLSATNDTITSIDDLASLCPTCHRIAHLRSPLPYAIDEIRDHLNAATAGQLGIDFAIADE